MDKLIDKGILDILPEITGRDILKWIIIIICLKILIYFLKRMVTCWYYKIDERLSWLKISQQTEQEIFDALDLQMEQLEKLEKRQIEQNERIDKIIDLMSKRQQSDS